MMHGLLVLAKRCHFQGQSIPFIFEPTVRHRKQSPKPLDRPISHRLIHGARDYKFLRKPLEKGKIYWPFKISLSGWNNQLARRSLEDYVKQ